MQWKIVKFCATEKKDQASQERFFFVCAKVTNRIVSNNAAPREGFSFFSVIEKRAKEVYYFLAYSCMKTEFFNMRSYCNPMHFKTTFKNSRRSLFYQVLILQLFELWLLRQRHTHQLHVLLLLFHILIRQCTFSRPTASLVITKHDIIMDQPQTNFSLLSLSSNHILLKNYQKTKYDFNGKICVVRIL